MTRMMIMTPVAQLAVAVRRREGHPQPHQVECGICDRPSTPSTYRS
jgi:hypothetical protein